MSVLVTGGTGDIGQWATRRLVEVEGIRPIIFDIAPDTTLLKDIKDKFEIVRGDARDFSHIARTVKEHEINRIIHMAALLGSSEENPPLTLQINFESLVNILEIARIFDIERIVYISSSAVYAGVIGEHGPPTYKPINEDYEFISPKLDPKGLRLYAITKLASELYGLYYAKTYGIDFVALRFSQPYGPEKVRRPTGSQIFTWMIENAMLRKPTKIQDELIKKDWIYRKDIAKGIVLASYAKQLKHRLFHLGSGKGITLLDLANAIKKVIPKAVIEIKQGPNQYNYGRHWVFDTSRAREELKFTPDYNLEESIKDYIETMRRLNISPVYTPLE